MPHLPVVNSAEFKSLIFKIADFGDLLHTLCVASGKSIPVSGCTQTMLLLEKNIPAFIQSSAYLQTQLSEGSWPEEGLEVPDGCAKQDQTIHNDADLRELLSTIRYWLVPEVAEMASDLLKYALNPSEPNSFASIAKDFERDIPFAKDLLEVHLAEDKVAQAARQGRLNILEVVCEGLGLLPTEAAGIVAAKHGHVDCLKYMDSRGLIISRNIYQSACEQGQLSTMKYLNERDRRWIDSAPKFAANSGNSKCIMYAIELKKVFHIPTEAPFLLQILAQESHSQCIELLLKLPGWDLQICIEYIMRGSVVSGHTHILEFGMEHLTDLQRLEEVIHLAVYSDRIDYLGYLRKHGGEYNIRCMATAAKYGHLEMMMYLHNDGCPWDETICNSAAQNGQLACLQYAHEHGCPWKSERTEFDGGLADEELVGTAACRAPTVDCLEYVVSQGAAFEQYMCAAFCLYSRCVPMLQFLHTHGVTWGRDHMRRLAEIGWLEGLVFLHETGAQWCEMTTHTAVHLKHISVLEYALRHGCPYSDYVLTIAKGLGPEAEECVNIMKQRDEGTFLAPISALPLRNAVPVLERKTRNCVVS